jgi:hypothetical protein
MALGALLGDNLKPVAFSTHDPTDGRTIIVVVSKPSGQAPTVERLEVLSGLGDVPRAPETAILQEEGGGT